MPKLPGLGQRDAVRALEKAGFSVIREGKHIIISNGLRIVQIPRHTSQGNRTKSDVILNGASARALAVGRCAVKNPVAA